MQNTIKLYVMKSCVHCWVLLSLYSYILCNLFCLLFATITTTTKTSCKRHHSLCHYK